VVVDELHKDASSELKKDVVQNTDTLYNATVKQLIDSSPTKTTLQKCLCEASNVASIEFKKPPELYVEKEEEEDNESCDREQTDKDVVSIEPRDNDSSPTETMQDDMAEIDSKESLEGVQYRHVVESETVAELEEIIYKEKEKSKLYDMSESAIKGRDITLEEAKNLRFLLFGTVSSTFDDVWTKQNIHLNDKAHHALRYYKGPTEGVMTCIQAHFLKHVLFGSSSKETNKESEAASDHKACLISAIVDILWQAGMHEKATVCLPSSKKDLLYSADLKPDGIIEKLQCFDFGIKEDLHNFIHQHFQFFEDDGRPGCILFIYSLILSRSIERVSKDIEGPNNCLIVHGACSQAMLNLLIFGRATPNTFNMSREIKNENGKIDMHYGISKRSEIGFLSLREAEDPKNSVVGSMLKTPVYPIWVAALQSNICVLFSKKRKLLSDWKLERRFELYCCGGLSRSLGVVVPDVRLTIDTVRPFDPDEYDYDFNSELEDTIRTKWQDCVIDWNGFRRF